MQKITIKDIARECNVSLSTVSLVLNNNPRISEATRAKVQESVRRHNYQPNNNARGLASRSSLAVSVVVPHLGHVFADVYFGEIISGIYDQAADDGYKVMLDIANEKFLSTKEYLGLLRSRKADGMLFIGANITDEFPMEFQESAYPFLLVNHFYPKTSLNYLAMDYRESAHKAVEHLVGLGHRHIGLVRGTNTHTGIEFAEAFEDYCIELGIDPQHLHTVDGGDDWDLESGYAATQQLMQKSKKITAIMAGNDRMAIGAISYLDKKGIQIPGDISVMGVDDIHSAAFSSPSLTTIWHDLYELGKQSFKRLLALYKKEITTCQERLPVTLIVRDSTGPVSVIE
ncbi:MAG: LacI family DNA-binding transcriptional regulator [Kiritimatiellae bacterium]|nr:LacI family DNA-binding transcriptional regulator [Kiritimatiellia bacterium]MDD4736655.1 LacI family DNA-binding transcriptional regulator [Kiritimatiellia bacterium]